MEQVKFKYLDGKVIKMDRVYADILQRIKRGEIVTDAPPPPPPVVPAPAPVAAPIVAALAVVPAPTPAPAPASAPAPAAKAPLAAPPIVGTPVRKRKKRH